MLSVVLLLTSLSHSWISIIVLDLFNTEQIYIIFKILSLIYTISFFASVFQLIDICQLLDIQ